MKQKIFIFFLCAFICNLTHAQIAENASYVTYTKDGMPKNACYFYLMSMYGLYVIAEETQNKDIKQLLSKLPSKSEYVQISDAFVKDKVITKDQAFLAKSMAERLTMVNLKASKGDLDGYVNSFLEESKYCFSGLKKLSR